VWSLGIGIDLTPYDTSYNLVKRWQRARKGYIPEQISNKLCEEEIHLSQSIDRAVAKGI
jgi:hypothetical protein